MVEHQPATNQNEKGTFIMAESIITGVQIVTWAGQLGALLDRTCGNAGEDFRDAGEDVQELFLSACRDLAHKLESALADSAMATPS